MASIIGDTKYYQPAPRAWHHAVSIGDRLYMWGGRTEDFSVSGRRKLASVVEIYDPYLEAWQQEATTGVSPPGLYNGGCTSVHESLLWYGGFDGKSCFETLHQLNTVSLKWEELHPSNTSQGPMAKYGCGMASFQGNKVALIGGIGTPSGPTQPGSTFTRNPGFLDGRGWTNEFHLFHLQEGVWFSPPTTGSRPPPCAHFTFTAINSNRGVLFGGLSPEHGKMNDVYIINLQTMHWTKQDKSRGGPWPMGRTLHAACCLNYGEEHPQLLVSGGRDKDGNTLRDFWVLDVEAGTWKELTLPQPRLRHTVTAFNMSPGIVEITMFGGSPMYAHGGDQQQPKIAETTVVKLESIENSTTGCAEWVVKDVTKGRQLGSPERIREKIEVKTAITLAGERRKAEGKITELEEKVGSAETQVRVALSKAKTEEHQLQSTRQILHTKEEELKALTTQYRATHDTLSHTQEQLSTQRQAHSRLQYTAQQKEEQLQVRVQSAQQLLHTKEEELEALTTQYRATQDKLSHTQEQLSTQQQAHRRLQYTAQQTQVQLQARVRSTQQLLHTKEEELKALTTQYRATQDKLLHTQQQFSTQQQALSQKEEQLQARVRENTALHTHSHALAKEVDTLQSKIVQMEQATQATQAALEQIPYLEQQLHSKQAQLQSLTEMTNWQTQVKPSTATVATQTDTSFISTLQPTQTSLQTGAIGMLRPQELQIQHAELQQRVAGETEPLLPAEPQIQRSDFQQRVTSDDTELLLQEIQEKKEEMRTLQTDKQDLEQQLKIKSIETEVQMRELTALKVEIQEIGEQVKALQLEKSDLEEKLAKEAFLANALGYEVDALRQDVMDKQQVQFHNTSTQTAVDDISSPGTSLTGSLKAEVVAERDFVITNQARSYCWDEYGFRLHVPEKSLEAGLSETTVNVRVSLSGHFQVPADSELVSAVYWVFTPHKFSQPLTVEVQHCAAPSQCSNLSFVRTKCTQKKLPYQFKELEGGVFSQQSFYGSISVNHFSGLGVSKRKRPRSEASESSSGTDEQQYCACLYKEKKGKGQYRLHFVVTKDLEACRTVVKKELSNLDTKKDLAFRVGFSDDQISLAVPRGGSILENGWKLTPLYDPVIKKNHVDRFSSRRHLELTECQLALRWLQDKPLAGFEHEIGLQGTADRQYFTLCIENTDQFSGSERDTPYLPRGVQNGENTPPTSNTSTDLFINKYRSGLQSTPELPDLMNEVAAKIPQKWHNVGIQLGIDYDQLQFLSVSTPPGSQQFASVFTAWKNCMKKDYTWAVLIEALKTPAVNEPRLAQELSAKFTV